MSSLLSFDPEPFDTEFLEQAEGFETELESEVRRRGRGHRAARPLLRPRRRVRFGAGVAAAPLYAPYALIEPPFEPLDDAPDREVSAKPPRRSPHGSSALRRS